MSEPTFPDAGPGGLAGAEVRAGGRVMRYRRSGSGRTLLVLPPPPGGDAIERELLDALGRRLRLVVPELPPDDDSSEWLSTFLEGLGIFGVGVLATDASRGTAFGLGSLESDRISAIVILAGTGEFQHPAIPTQHHGIPLLVLPAGRPTDELTATITSFFGGDAPSDA